MQGRDEILKGFETGPDKPGFADAQDQVITYLDEVTEHHAYDAEELGDAIASHIRNDAAYVRRRLSQLAPHMEREHGIYWMPLGRAMSAHRGLLPEDYRVNQHSSKRYVYYKREEQLEAYVRRHVALKREQHAL